MTFGFEMDALRESRAAESDRYKAREAANQFRDRQAENERGIAELDAKQRALEGDNIELARLKAQKKKSDFAAGVVDKREQEAQKSDFERLKETGDYNLSNQQKAWESANTLRMREADQSNVAQKDRLGMQLGTQKEMQQAQIGQENRLRSDDFDRAVKGFKGNI